jgi:hypothetical protein
MIRSRHENRKPFAPNSLKIPTHQHRCNKVDRRQIPQPDERTWAREICSNGMIEAYATAKSVSKSHYATSSQDQAFNQTFAIV